MSQFTRFIRKVFAVKILLSGKFLLFLTLLPPLADINYDWRFGALPLRGPFKNITVFFGNFSQMANPLPPPPPLLETP